MIKIYNFYMEKVNFDIMKFSLLELFRIYLVWGTYIIFLVLGSLNWNFEFSAVERDAH